MTKKENAGFFWRAYVLFFGVLIAAVIFGLHYLESFLKDYEQTRPAYLMKALISDLDRGEYSEFVDKSDLFKSLYADGLIDQDDEAEMLRGAIGDATLSFKKIYSSDRIAHPAFNLMADERVVSTVFMALRQDKSRFGLNQYTIDRIDNFGSDIEDRIFVVPEGYRIVVDGITLTDKWIVSTADDTYDEKFMLNQNSGITKVNTYRISGHIPIDKMSVLRLDGTEAEITADSGRTVAVETESVVITAPSGVQVLVNGVEISQGDTWLAAKPVEFDILERIPERYFEGNEKPTIREYRVTGLMSKPDVQVSHPQQQLDIKQENNAYTVSLLWPDTDKDSHLAMALEFAKLHARTTTNDYGKQSYISKILADAPLRSELQIGLRPEFYTSHSKYWFEDETVGNLIYYTEDCFSSDVSLVHCIGGIRTRGTEEQRFKFSMRLCFVRTNGVWRLAEWALT